MFTEIRLFTGSKSGGYRLSRVRAAWIEQEKASLALTKKQNDIETALIEIRLRLNEAGGRIEAARFIETAALPL